MPISDLKNLEESNFDYRKNWPRKRQHSEILDLRQTTTEACVFFDTWNLSETQRNVFVHSRSLFDPSQTPYQGILHSTNPSATGAIPVQVCTGRPVARG